ncbi:MAG: hypothetical protein JSR91_04860 [Proteobacteria bacterium]|nr:hypothetical protein [Pseudomonadota bacterium]
MNEAQRRFGIFLVAPRSAMNVGIDADLDGGTVVLPVHGFVPCRACHPRRVGVRIVIHPFTPSPNRASPNIKSDQPEYVDLGRHLEVENADCDSSGVT